MIMTLCIQIYLNESLKNNCDISVLALSLDVNTGWFAGSSFQSAKSKINFLDPILSAFYVPLKYIHKY